MFDNILRSIWAILTLSFVGLIFYFRKPLTSILHALSDMDSLKAGPLEFKRRKAINKVVKDIVVSKSVSASIAASKSAPISASISSSITHSSEVRIKHLEKENASLKKQLLGLAAVFASTTLDPELAEYSKILAKHLYSESFAIDPNSKFLENVSKLLNLTTGDRIGVGEDTKVEVVGKNDVNAPDEIPPEESKPSNTTPNPPISHHEKKVNTAQIE